MSCFHRLDDGSCEPCYRDAVLDRRYGERKTDIERLTEADWRWIDDVYKRAKQEIENERQNERDKGSAG